MVNAFSDYAKAPELKREAGGLNKLINASIDLYFIANAGINFQLELLETRYTRYNIVIHLLFYTRVTVCQDENNSYTSIPENDDKCTIYKYVTT